MTAGNSVHNPAELINSKKMGEFIAEAKRMFDFVIFDSPPVISVTAQSSGISSTEVDGKILVRRPSNQIGSRGISVAVIDPRLGVRSSSVKSFSAGVDSKTGVSALNDYIQSFSAGTVFAISMVSEGGAPSPSRVHVVSRTMAALGSTKINQVPYQGNWAMIAVKGQGVLAEAYSDPRIPVTIRAMLPAVLSSDAAKT